MTQLAVTDANVFIDLIILGLIRHLFELNIEIHTTREVFDQLTLRQKEVLSIYYNKGQLNIYDFSADEIIEIYNMAFPAGLETADRTVFYYAKRLACLVISGDNKLRKHCERKGLEVHGLIWIFDRIVELELIAKHTAVEKLEKLMSYNDRLPADELLKRLKKWK
jgi:predicted nucleic acid-binding protein